MELKEAIEHAEQKAQDLNCSCREDHGQLAKWLKELAARRGADKTAVTKEFLGKIMELKDTVALMTSEDYRERFKAEYLQLKIRIGELNFFVEKKLATPDLLLVMTGQLNYMINYMSLLKYRAKLEGINLEE